MARTVKVNLLLEAARYLRGARESAKATGDVKDSVDDLGRAGDKASKSTDRLGGELSDLAVDARRLDGQIDETTRGIRELAREIAHTSDVAERAKLRQKLVGEQGKQRELTSIRNLIDFDDAGGLGEELASKVSLTFAQRIGPLIARAPLAGMNPAALAIGAPLAAGAAITVGTAMAGAIVGGVGLGGVVGGLKIAAKDPAVKAAGTALGTTVGGMLQRAAAPMVPEALGAIETLRQEALLLEPDLRRVFSSASRYVAPLTRGLTDAAHNAMPGLVDAVEHAGPVVDVLADGMRDLGDAVGDSLSDLSQYADEGARALDVLFLVAENGVRGMATLIGSMAELYGWAEKLGAVATGRTDRLAQLVAADNAAGQSARGLAGGLDDVRDAARGAHKGTGDLIDALVELNGLQLNANDAEREFQRAIDDAREAFHGKTRDFVGATEKGREYGAALDDIATEARDSAQAIYDNTGSVANANAKVEEGRVALYNQARQYGRTDKEARDYVNSVLTIPRKWDTKVTLHADEALRDAKAVRSVIQSLRDRNITIGVRWQTNGDLKVPGGTLPKNRWGGVYEHARAGLVNLRQAGVYSAMGPARYAFAEPATGGEAFIPKYGDPRRSLAIMEQAASWYGATVRPQAAPAAMPRPATSAGGGTSVYSPTYNVNVAVPPNANLPEVGRETVRAIQAYERGNTAAWRRR